MQTSLLAGRLPKQLHIFNVEYALACLVHYQTLAHPKGYATESF